MNRLLRLAFAAVLGLSAVAPTDARAQAATDGAGAEPATDTPVAPEADDTAPPPDAGSPSAGAERGAARSEAAMGAPATSPGEPEATSPVAGLTDICAIDPSACPQLDLEREAAKDLHEVIYAVQPLYAKRKHRFHLLPYGSISLNDQFVQHPSLGFATSFYLAEFFALGATMDFFRPFNVDSAFNADVRRASRVGVPLSEHAWSASVDLTYVAGLGKFSGIGAFIFTWDVYLVGGLGTISTRPKAVIDPENRAFSFTNKLMGRAGIGTRIFFNRWLTTVLELRDNVFQEHLESLQTPIDPVTARDPDTWYGEREVVHDVQALAGVGLFVPFTFRYRLPQ